MRDLLKRTGFSVLFLFGLVDVVGQCGGENRWLGITSAFEEETNWSLGEVPCEQSDIIIPSNTPQMCIIGAFNGTVRSLEIAENATLKFKSGGSSNYFGISESLIINGMLVHSGGNEIFLEDEVFIEQSGEWQNAKIALAPNAKVMLQSDMVFDLIRVGENAILDLQDADTYTEKLFVEGLVSGMGGRFTIEGSVDQIAWDSDSFVDYNGVLQLTSGINFPLKNQILPAGEYFDVQIVQADTFDIQLGNGEPIDVQYLEIVNHGSESVEIRSIVNVDHMVLGDVSPIKLDVSGGFVFEDEGSLIVNGNENNNITISASEEINSWLVNCPANSFLKGNVFLEGNALLSFGKYDQIESDGIITVSEDVYAYNWNLAGGEVKTLTGAKIYLEGDLINQNNLLESIDIDLVCIGGSDQSLYGLSALNSLEMNKESGKLILNQELGIDEELRLVAGIIDASSYPLTILSTTPDAIVGGGNESFIIGELIRKLDANDSELYGDYLFPIGLDEESALSMISFNGFKGEGFDELKMQYQYFQEGDTSIIDSVSLFDDGFWLMEGNAESYSGEFDVYFESENTEKLGIGFREEGLNEWTLFGQELSDLTVGGVGMSGQNGHSDLGDFLFYLLPENITNEINDSDVEHSEIAGFEILCEEQVVINILTSRETEGEQMIIDKWLNNNWQLVEKISFDFNSTQVKAYSVFDDKIESSDLYRLRIMNENAVYIEKQMVLNCADSEGGIGISNVTYDPESSELEVIVQSEENQFYELAVYDVAGKNIYWEKAEIEGENKMIKVSMPDGSGYYFVKIVSRSGENVKKFLIH